MSKLIYVLVGVAIGVLIAPDKGSATRAKLAERLNDFTDGLDEFSEEAAHEVRTRADHFQEKLLAKGDEIEQKIQENF